MGPPKPTGRLRRWPLGFRGAWIAVGWSATLLAVAWGMHRMDRLVRAAQANATCRLEWADLPPWLSGPSAEQTLQQLSQAANLRPEADVHDPALCRRVGEGLAQSPWVAEVKRVSKRADGVVRAHATFREPFAFVESAGVVYLVDSAGVRLPHRYLADYVQDRFWNDWLRITGATGAVPDEGQPWPGDDLAAGLRLAAYLKEATARGEVPFRSSLRAIDVSNAGLRRNKFDGQLRIRTVQPRGYIDWGLPPGEEYNVECTAARKLEMLRALYAERGQLPEATLDVRGSDGIRVRESPAPGGSASMSKR
jgi:hypothetical protein